MEGGRPRTFGSAARDQICRIAACEPVELGLPFTTWSLSKLVDYLAEHAWITVSTETVRQILRDEGVSWQATKTWKASKDPDFVAKKNRILDLYDHPPNDGRVICVDEFGPLNLQPRPGRGWFRRGEPARRRATYTRTKGVQHMFAALDQTVAASAGGPDGLPSTVHDSGPRSTRNPSDSRPSANATVSSDTSGARSTEVPSASAARNNARAVRLTFAGNILETGATSYRLAHARSATAH